MKKLTLNNLRESDIQHLYYQFPYLINKEYINYQKEQFVKIKGGIIDILLTSEEELVVIELKKVNLENTHLLQLYQYMKEMAQLNEDKKVNGILIGKKEKKKLDSLLKTLEFKIEIKILEEDVPINAKICKNCRFANSINIKSCFNCKGTFWI